MDREGVGDKVWDCANLQAGPRVRLLPTLEIDSVREVMHIPQYCSMGSKLQMSHFLPMIQGFILAPTLNIETRTHLGLGGCGR